MSRFFERAFANMPRHLVGAFGLAIAVYIISIIFEKEIPEANRDIALIILGIAISWADRVFSFHFGSSDGSKRLSSTISDMAREGYNEPRRLPPPGRDARAEIDPTMVDDLPRSDPLPRSGPLPKPTFPSGSGDVDEPD